MANESSAVMWLAPVIRLHQWSHNNRLYCSSSSKTSKNNNSECRHWLDAYAAAVDAFQGNKSGQSGKNAEWRTFPSATSARLMQGKSRVETFIMDVTVVQLDVFKLDVTAERAHKKTQTRPINDRLRWRQRAPTEIIFSWFQGWCVLHVAGARGNFHP